MIILVGVIVGVSRNDKGNEASPFPSSRFDGSSASDSDDDDKDEIPYDHNKPWTYHRLPRVIEPNHYSILLEPHFYNDNDSWFQGNVSIQAHVLSGTRYVILHALELNLTETSIEYVSTIESSNQKLPANPRIKSIFIFEPYQYLVIELADQLLKESNIEIKINFTGSLGVVSEGFYKSFFRHPTTGVKQFVAMTQFEPLDARRAFPCFDEPNMKAFFTISLRHWRGFTALSNMPVQGTTWSEDDPNWMTTSFERTSVPMSTYLVAVTIGEFTSLPTIIAPETQLPVKVYVPEYALEQSQYSRSAITSLIDWQQRFFAIQYPLPKVDFVIYPTFRWTAMENWGLITFREDALLVTNETTEVDKDHVVAVIAHELAHQWFGNLVTMDWWDDLWLNEGFASYMEYPSSIAVGRGVDSEEYYDYMSAMAADGFRSSRPIRFLQIKRRSDISAAFDSITYQKGATIIRMLVNAMGVESFKHGIQEYMATFKFKNAKTSDLWDTLAKQMQAINLTNVMRTWVEQKGYPIVDVQPGLGGDELILKQRPFIMPQYQPEPFNGGLPSVMDSRRWWIPVTVKDPTGEIRTEWFPPDKDEFIVRVPGQLPKETKLNMNQTAFMRINYPVEMWENFGNQLAQDIVS